MRRRLVAYLVAVHAVFAGVVFYGARERVELVVATEGLFAASLAVGLRMLHRLGEPATFVEAGSRLIEERDFTTRFVETGRPELDRLIHIYNRMVDQLRAERTHQQELNIFLERLITASPAGIVTCDFDGRVVLVNPSAEQVLGVPAGRLQGEPLAALPAPFGEALGPLENGQARLVSLDGRRRVKCWRSQFMDRGFPRAFVLLEELTEELRQTEKAAYERLIRLLAHEVNNTTGTVTSLLHSCLHYAGQIGEADRPDFETALRVAIARADHLGAFMRRLAEVVRLPTPERRPTDVQVLLHDLVLLLQPETRRRGVAWRWDVQAPLPPVSLDPYQMERAFVNILKNAVEAVDDGGTITVRTGHDGTRPFVTVENTGAGLSPAVRTQLFTPFFTTKEQGHGLGLALVQEILTRHAFPFTLDGAPGEPTRFTVWL